MKNYARPLICFSLALTALILNWITQYYPDQLLRIYSHSLNKITIQGLSRFTGWVPFSVFEGLVYILVLALISYVLYSIFECIKNRRKALTILKWMLLNMASGAAVLYFAFMVLWGLNYNRPTLAEEIQLEIVDHSTEDLIALIRLLTHGANTAREAVLENEEGVFTTNEHYREVFARAPLGFEVLGEEERFAFLLGTYGRPKPIFASPLMNYTFITGIYSPFTGEANVNIAVPETTLLFTTLHEMVHQRGVTQENETNFIAYLTCLAHPDADFQYSGYFKGLGYARSALRRTDPDALLELNGLLSQGVIDDINYEVDFWRDYQGPIEETFTQINESYLKANGVTDGVESYGQVVDLLLAHYSHELNDYRD